MHLTEAQVHERLVQAIDVAGGQKMFAKQHRFSQSYVSDVIKRRRPLAGRILEAIGIDRVVVFVDSGAQSGAGPQPDPDRAQQDAK